GRPGGPEVVWLGSWTEALDCLAACAESREDVAPVNRLRYQARERCPDLYRGWGAVAEAVRPRINALVSAKTGALGFRPFELKLMRDVLGWDLMHACMEEEFAESCDISYHRERVGLLLAGHCPCGWSGEFPEGRHVAL